MKRLYCAGILTFNTHTPKLAFAGTQPAAIRAVRALLLKEERGSAVCVQIVNHRLAQMIQWFVEARQNEKIMKKVPVVHEIIGHGFKYCFLAYCRGLHVVDPEHRAQCLLQLEASDVADEHRALLTFRSRVRRSDRPLFPYTMEEFSWKLFTQGYSLAQKLFQANSLA